MKKTVTTEYKCVLAEPGMKLPGERIDARMPEIYEVLVGTIVENLNTAGICYDNKKSSVTLADRSGKQGGEADPRCTRPLYGFLKEEEVISRITARIAGKALGLHIKAQSTPRHKLTADIDLEMRTMPSGDGNGVLDLTIRTSYSAREVKNRVIGAIRDAYNGHW